MYAFHTYESDGIVLVWVPFADAPSGNRTANLLGVIQVIQINAFLIT